MADLKAANISNSGFFISRAMVEISGKGIEEKVVCSIKYNYPDKYLITLRTRSGIEVGRMFVTSDTVLVNDRINRKLYYGSGKALNLKYGISSKTFPLIFGDYLSDGEDGRGIMDCVEQVIRKRCIVDGSVIEYTIDCNEDKPVFVLTGRNNELNLKYGNFRKAGLAVFPEDISIEDVYRKLKVRLSIEKIESPWEGSIEFIPGARYELIPLL